MEKVLCIDFELKMCIAPERLRFFNLLIIIFHTFESEAAAFFSRGGVSWQEK